MISKRSSRILFILWFNTIAYLLMTFYGFRLLKNIKSSILLMIVALLVTIAAEGVLILGMHIADWLELIKANIITNVPLNVLLVAFSSLCVKLSVDSKIYFIIRGLIIIALETLIPFVEISIYRVKEDDNKCRGVIFANIISFSLGQFL